MPGNVPPVPYKSPIADRSGRVTHPWADWFRQLFSRVGGFSSPSNSDISRIITSLGSIVTDQGDSINTIQTAYIAELQSDVNDLKSDVNDLRLGPTL